MYVRYEGLANLSQGFEGVGGTLYLMADHLRFEPHRINIQGQTEEIPLKDILEINKAESLGFIPNSFILKTHLRDYKFVVKKRNYWVDAIREALTSQQN
ncbi:MAG: hypothetical protein P1U56_19600 [Saprospiraceae bacterium]|nr:hypothetical protein [Saprospiraceae bacterium]